MSWACTRFILLGKVIVIAFAIFESRFVGRLLKLAVRDELDFLPAAEDARAWEVHERSGMNVTLSQGRGPGEEAMSHVGDRGGAVAGHVRSHPWCDALPCDTVAPLVAVQVWRGVAGRSPGAPHRTLCSATASLAPRARTRFDVR